MAGETVAVIGLGAMGLGMAARLHAAGIAPLAFDIAPARRTLTASTLIETADDLDAAVAGRSIIILSLPHDAAVADVVARIAAGAAARAVVVDTSTISVASVADNAAVLAVGGRAYLDAPVSGGPAGAASGSLTAMVGGDAVSLARVRPVLDHLAARIVHVGASGAGQVAKLANNLLVATHLIAAAEALRMARAAGVAPDAVLEVVNAASGRSGATEVNFPRWLLSGSFDSGFAAGLMRKDVRLAMALAEQVGVAAPVLARAAETWLRRSEAVAGTADFNRVAAFVLEGGDG